MDPKAMATDIPEGDLTERETLEELKHRTTKKTASILGRIPPHNAIFVLNEVRYVVIASDFARGKFTAKVCKD